MRVVSLGGNHREWWILIVGLMLAPAGICGCQAGAELEFYRPRLEQLAPLALRRIPQPTLQLTLLDVQGFGVTEVQRIGAAGRSWWMDQVVAEDFVMEGLTIQPASGGAGTPINAVVAGRVQYMVRPSGGHLVLVLDNSTAAALADPEALRIVGLRALVDRIFCRPHVTAVATSCDPRGDLRVSLILLQDGVVEVKVKASVDSAELHSALATAGSSAGGTALLWDGLVRSRELLSSAKGAVLLLASSAADGGSKLDSAAVHVAWRAGAVPLYTVITGQGASSNVALEELAASTGGALVLRPADLQGALLSAGAAAMQGHWALSINGLDALPLAVTTGDYSAIGVVSLSLGTSRWSSGFTLPVLRK